MDKNSGNSLLGFLASIILVAILIGGGVFVYNYFISAHKDIVSKDVKIEILKEGEGESARQGDSVLVNYIGELTDGTEFDNSYKRGQPFPVVIGEGRVIQGWEKGLLGIKKGEKRKLTIPPDLGYGDHGIPDQTGTREYLIPPNSVLIFTIEALSVDSHGFLK